MKVQGEIISLLLVPTSSPDTFPGHCLFWSVVIIRFQVWLIPHQKVAGKHEFISSSFPLEIKFKFLS